MDSIEPVPGGYAFKDYSHFFKISIPQRRLEVFRIAPRARRLRKRLLGIGGKEIVWHISEPHIDLLLNRGRRFPARSAVVCRGEPSDCHGNTALLYVRGKADIITGYALSRGLWAQHSWGFTDGKVVETTEPRTAYFGVVLDGADALRFALGNTTPQEFKRAVDRSSAKNKARLHLLIASTLERTLERMGAK